MNLLKDGDIEKKGTLETYKLCIGCNTCKKVNNFKSQKISLEAFSGNVFGMMGSKNTVKGWGILCNDCENEDIIKECILCLETKEIPIYRKEFVSCHKCCRDCFYKYTDILKILRQIKYNKLNKITKHLELNDDEASFYEKCQKFDFRMSYGPY